MQKIQIYTSRFYPLHCILTKLAKTIHKYSNSVYFQQLENTKPSGCTLLKMSNKKHTHPRLSVSLQCMSIYLLNIQLATQKTTSSWVFAMLSRQHIVADYKDFSDTSLPLYYTTSSVLYLFL